MAHELTIRKNGFTEMAYVGAAPWHGLGQQLQVGASIEQWQQAAGMDWQIRRSRVRFGGSDQPQIFADHHVLFRSDTKAPLSIVGQGYKVVHPGEVLEFFRDLAEANDFVLHTAGTLFGGKRFWALASIGESAVVTGMDKVEGYLLLSSSCDGSSATNARFTTVRVVCNNTLSMAMSGKAQKEFTVSHRTTFDPRIAKAQLGIATDAFSDFMKASRKLANRFISYSTAEQFVAALLKDTKTVTLANVEESTGFMGIMELFQHGAGNNGANAWDLVNGVTEYVDHVQRAKTESNRLANCWFGKGDQLKTLAFERALAI